MLNGYKAAEKYLDDIRTPFLRFLKRWPKGSCQRKGQGAGNEAIGQLVKIDDKTTLDDAYDAYASYWETSFAVRDQVIRAELGYLNEKEFPQAKNANSRKFFDNSFVEKLEKAGFFRAIGINR